MDDLPTDPTVGTTLTATDRFNAVQTWTASKYKDDEYPQLLLDHLSKGLSFMSFNVPGGVSNSTLHNWSVKFPAFAQAREIGEKARLQMLEDEGMKMIKGGNVIAWKFMMNQMGIAEKVEINHTHKNHPGNPHTSVPPSIRYDRLQRLKELHQRVVKEGNKIQVIEAEIETKSEGFDALLD